MGIKVNNNIITLNTKNTSYQMKIDEFSFLLHSWYGNRIDDEDDLSYVNLVTEKGFSPNPYETFNRAYSLDNLPQEYSTYGNGDFRADCIQVVHEDGSNVLDLRYEAHDIIKGKYALEKLPAFFWNEDEGETLIITLADRETGIKVELLYGVLEKYDIITRAVRIINTSDRLAVIEKAYSLCLDFTFGEYELIHFYGRHAMEREFERSSLVHGRVSFESGRGTSSHQQNPFAILASKNADETNGSCYGAALVYSGSFKCETEVDQINQTRLVMGVNPEQFSYHLKAGESVTLPEAVLTYSNSGFEKLTHSFHDAVRNHLLRGQFVHKHRPTLINNWEATYLDFNGEKIVDIAKKAAELGLEMLVLDDGWFGKRDIDNSGLGDWVVNEKKLGRSLKELVDEVNALGLKFGLWFEPEMISEDSDLYRTHPDWMIRIPNRKGVKSREQYVLDYTREDVRAGIEKMIRDILDTCNIEYIKWDMNRSIAAVYSHKLDAKNMGEFHFRYVLGLYSLLETLTTSYPNVLFEGCSGGGGRYDLGMMYYYPQIWCSDDTDAVERLKIQYGSSFAYPISCAGSHVSASPNHQTHRETPFDTRATVAMDGTFGYELDLNKLSSEEQSQVKEQVKEYKKYEKLILEGDYFRINSPYDNSRICAWQHLSKDKSFGLLSIVVQKLEANPTRIIVYPRGLEPEARYEIGGNVRLGKTWLNVGYLLPEIKKEYQSFRLEIKKV